MVSERRGRPDVIAHYGGRVSRDTAIYMSGMVAVFPFSIVQAIVLTRLLDPSEYGRLALLLFLAGLVTVLASLGTLTGMFRYVYAAGDTGDDDAEDDADVIVDEDDTAAALVSDKKRALGTGMWLLATATALLATPLIVGAPGIADWLLDVDGGADLVRWATLSGAAGVAFRLAHNLLRLERRPTMFSIVAVFRPALVVGLAAWLVLEGEGLKGVLIATTAGTVAATVLAATVSWSSYGFGFSRRHAAGILRRGAPYIPINIAMWSIHNADVLLLSRTASTADVGVYRLASRLASVPSYFSSAFMLAQSSLERSSLVQGTYGRLEGRGVVRTHLVTYYLAASLTIVLVLSITADLLVRVAAPSYSDAAGLIPFVALSLVVYGTFLVIFRVASVRRARVLRVVLIALATAIFGGVSILLLPELEAYALPLAQIAGMGTATAILVFLAVRRSKEPLELQWSRIGATLASAAACLVVGFAIARELQPELEWLLGLGALAAYPFLLIATGAIPREHVATLRAVVAASLRPTERTHQPLLEGLQELDEDDRVILERLYRDRVSPETVAELEGIPPSEVAIRLARALEELVGATPVDAEQATELGEYLLYRMDTSTAARDAIAGRLRNAGVDGWHLHELEAAAAALRRAPRPAWG